LQKGNKLQALEDCGKAKTDKGRVFKVIGTEVDSVKTGHCLIISKTNSATATATILIIRRKSTIKITTLLAVTLINVGSDVKCYATIEYTCLTKSTQD